MILVTVKNYIAKDYIKKAFHSTVSIHTKAAEISGGTTGGLGGGTCPPESPNSAKIVKEKWQKIS